jgi:pyruvate,water dikinase
VEQVRDPETGENIERAVAAERRNAQVLDEDEIDRLVDMAKRIEDHYDEPQDVEWAMADDDVFMLQSRPITTIDQGEIGSKPDAAANGGEDESLTSGHGASPGIASGDARIVGKLDQLDKVGEGDLIVTEMTTPDMVPAMKRAAGIVTDEGGMTSHAAIVSRELGVPAVVGTGDATQVIDDGEVITIDGDRGSVRRGAPTEAEEREPIEEARPKAPVKPMTATEVKVNVSIPEAAERAAATGADGVGLLRMEHMIMSTNKTPGRYISDHGVDAYIQEIVDGVRGVAEEFYPRPVRVRTLDAPTDEFRQLEGGDDEPAEHNPMLGYRGIRRSLDAPDVFAHELAAFKRLYELGYDNVEIMLPLVNDEEDVIQARQLLEEAGIDTEKRHWGVMIETPASAMQMEEMAREGIDFASFGTNDLTQYTLAVDRNNELVADRFDELHPAILKLIAQVIECCRDHDVQTSICGQAGSRPEMVRFLVNEGISSISANIDAVRDVQHEVKRIEQKLILDAVRD